MSIVECLEFILYHPFSFVISHKFKKLNKSCGQLYVSNTYVILNFSNAGFDPAVIRVDPYGNVVYFHADSASPLAWDVDHWFPCSSMSSIPIIFVSTFCFKWLST